MAALKSQFLFNLTANLGEFHDIGSTPFGERRVATVTGGTVEGPRLKGTLLPGAIGDWVLVDRGGCFRLDVRGTLKTDDDHLIYISYRGLRHAAPEVAARLAAGEAVDPAEYYFRIAPVFETGSEKYGWLNHILAIGVGERLPQAVRYQVHEIL
jgi:hypothetical protein